MKIYNIKGNTYYFETKSTYMPFYKITENEIIMLDSGMYEYDSQIIQNLIDEFNFTVKAIICTHAHTDHVGNNFWLKEKYNAEIIMPEMESFICESMYNLKAYFITTHIKNVDKRFKSMVFQTDRKISNKDEFIDVCGHKFEIVKLYGHTFYHIGIITPDNVFYVGDSLMSSDVMKDTKLAYVADISTDLETKNRLRSIKCDKYILAHKGIYDDIGEVIDENIQYLENQMQFIIDIIKKPMTISEIFSEIFKQLNINKHVITFVLTEKIITQYINYLVDYGVIKQEVIDYTLKYCPNKHNVL